LSHDCHSFQKRQATLADASPDFLGRASRLGYDAGRFPPPPVLFGGSLGLDDFLLGHPKNVHHHVFPRDARHPEGSLADAVALVSLDGDTVGVPIVFVECPTEGHGNPDLGLGVVSDDSFVVAHVDRSEGNRSPPVFGIVCGLVEGTDGLGAEVFGVDLVGIAVALRCRRIHR